MQLNNSLLARNFGGITLKFIRPLFKFCAQGVATSLILAASAYAANVTITTGSTFPNTAPVSTYTAPGGTWTLTFQVASQPVASSFNGGFTTTYTNGVFTLNGTPITLTGSSISFYPFSNGGGFSMSLDSSFGLSVTGNGSPNFFTGSNSSPTMVLGHVSGKYP